MQTSESSPTEVSLRGYARLHGWAPSYVHRLRHQHGLPTTPTGRIEPAIADQWLKANAIGERNEASAAVNQRRRERRAKPPTARPPALPDPFVQAFQERLSAALTAAFTAFVRELTPTPGTGDTRHG